MDISPTTLILVGIVCVILGFLASVLMNTLAEEGEAPDEGTDEAPPGGRKGRYTPIVRLWRERSSSALVVEMEGKSMVAPGPLTETQREQLEKTARDLRVWLGMGLTGSEVSHEPILAATPTTQPQVEEIDFSRAIQPAALAQPSSPVIAASLPAVSKPNPAAPGVSAPVVRPAAAQTGLPKGKNEAAAAPPAKSMVMQIEDILQDMLAGTPLEQRGIHLTEDPMRGVLVQVGLDMYEGIEAVPDAEIKKIIRTAVQDWETTQ